MVQEHGVHSHCPLHFPVAVYLQEPQAAKQDEFPGLAFGIKDMDQRQKYPSADSSQDFPSLGSAAGAEGGAKPAGVWGKGAGRLAGGFTSQVLPAGQICCSLFADLSVISMGCMHVLSSPNSLQRPCCFRHVLPGDTPPILVSRLKYCSFMQQKMNIAAVGPRRL